MAGDGKPAVKVVDMDTEVIHQYGKDAERFDKLSAQAHDKITDLTNQRNQVAQQHAEATETAREANHALDEANRNVDLQDKYVKSLERQHEELGKEIDAAQASGDTTRVKELDDQYGQGRVEIEKAQQQLGEIQARQQVTQSATEAQLQQLTELDTQVKGFDDQVSKVEGAIVNFDAAAREYHDAARYQDLSNVAAGGDPAATRQAVLAEADRVSDEWHKMATDQAKTFEDYKQADASLKTLNGERDISQRMQQDLKSQVDRAQQAGHTDEAASLQRELDWRNQHLMDLDTRIAADTAKVTDLKGQSDFQHEQAQALHQSSDDLRKLSNAKPEEVEAKFTERQEQSAHDGMVYTPMAGSDGDTVAKDLEASQAAAATGTPDDGTTPADGTPTSDASGTDDGTTDTAAEGPDAAAAAGTAATGSADDATTPATPTPDASGTADGTTDTAAEGPNAPAAAAGALNEDPGASLDDIDTPATPPTQGTDSPASPTPEAQTTVAEDPGASLDDIETPQAPAAAAAPEPQADVAPPIVDDIGEPEATQPAAVDTGYVEQPAPVDTTAADDTSQDSDAAAYDAPPAEPESYEDPGYSPPAEPDPEPDPAPEAEADAFAE